MFKGSYVAMVTPFRDGKLDEEGVRSLVEFHVENGTHGIVACGTTGESATLSHEEHDRVVELVIEQVNGRIPVIAGSGSNSTAEAVQRTQYAMRAGADGALLVAPYYNKPTQEGLYQHFRAIAESADIPIVLYNVPGRTVVQIAPDTVARLSEIPNIVGIKEATGDLANCCDIVSRVPDDFIVLSGDDFVTLPMMAMGGVGTISVTANVAPADVAPDVPSPTRWRYRHGESAALQDVGTQSHDVLRNEPYSGESDSGDYGAHRAGIQAAALRAV